MITDDKVKSKYGFLPLSIMDFDDEGWEFEDQSLSIDLIRRNSGYFKNYPFSKFSFGLSEFVIKYWSKPGDVVLDQYMGWGIRGVVAIKLDRRYVGYDISPQMFERGKNYIDYLQTRDVNVLFNARTLPEYKLIYGDGTKLEDMKDNCIDLGFTCPPYWNIEKYEDVPRQLSSTENYEDFLALIKEGLVCCKRVLKVGRFIVYVVADFRTGGDLKNFHGDMIEIGKSIGLKHWDTIVSVLRSPLPLINIGQCDKFKYTSKKHEYVIVFKKVMN
jgi:DNA modification methylase